MIALSIRLKQDKFSRRRPPQCLNAAHEIGDMNLQLVALGLKKGREIVLIHIAVNSGSIVIEICGHLWEG